MSRDYTKGLALKLIRACRLDQAMRKKWAKRGFDYQYYDRYIDKKNTDLLKVITKEIGWPSFGLVGRRAAKAAWLLLQHSPSVSFQKAMLEKMKILPSNEIDPMWLAQTIDRVKVNSGLKQLYGTSYRIFPKTGKIILDPIYNRKDLDRRRRILGLPLFKKSHQQVMARLWKRISL